MDATRRVAAAVARDSAYAAVLPRWPLTLMIAWFPLWWATGLADMAWIPIACCMLLLMLRRGRLRVPRGIGIWFLFLLLMLISVIGIDTSGRLVGFIYRALLYLTVTVVFVYIYNARERVSLQYVLGLLTLLWVYTWIGGYAGVFFPEFSFRSPLAYVLPQSMLSNEVVGEMAIRRTAQYNADGWFDLEPRPSAPFLYTNAWGNVYSLTLPIAVAYLEVVRRGWKFWFVLLAVPVSLVPAILSLNRGMFIGLGVAAAYLFVRFMFAGRFREVLALGTFGAVALVAAASLDVFDRLTDRVEVSGSTTTRSMIYEETWTRTLDSPLFGYGAPRPSYIAEPAVGTQGHVWMVMFSHGLPALVCFLLALGWFFWATARWRRPAVLVLHTVQLVIFVECFYYGLLPNGLIVSFMAAAIALREFDPVPIDAAARCSGETAIETGTEVAASSEPRHPIA
ncbi:O-antigen ligase family protein [Leucobacter sp. HY1908]